MHLKLHANAVTTPRTRTYIQASTASVTELAAEFGISRKTVERWRGRTTTDDHTSRPKRITTSLSPLEEELVCELRTRLDLPLDDIVEVMRRCVKPDLSRSATHRCLQRHGISNRPKPAKPISGRFEDAPIGFIHIDLKHLPALEKRKSYAFVAIDRATRYVYVEIHPRRDAATSAAFLERFLAHFPAKVHTILTDRANVYLRRLSQSESAESDKRSRWVPSSPTASPSICRESPKTNPPATIPSTRLVRKLASSIA
jgi:transposase